MEWQKVYLVAIIVIIAILGVTLGISAGYTLINITGKSSQRVTITVFQKTSEKPQGLGINYYLIDVAGNWYCIGNSHLAVTNRQDAGDIYRAIIVGKKYTLIKDCRSSFWGVEGFQTPVRCE